MPEVSHRLRTTGLGTLIFILGFSFILFLVLGLVGLYSLFLAYVLFCSCFFSSCLLHQFHGAWIIFLCRSSLLLISFTSVIYFFIFSLLKCLPYSFLFLLFSKCFIFFFHFFFYLLFHTSFLSYLYLIL